MNFILYDLIFIIFALAYLPLYILKGKFHPGFLERLGFLPKDLTKRLSGKKPIWIHAVSVGEALAVKLLAAELRKLYPDTPIVISTVTPTGNKAARPLLGRQDFLIYLPVDISFIVNKVIDIVHPAFFIIAETELWPNLISCMAKRNIPVAVVNARISDGSFQGYKLVKFLIKPLLNKISLFCVQTETDALRLEALGLEKRKISLCGNMKFDNAAYFDKSDIRDGAVYRDLLGLKQADMLFVAGCTHRGEEELILQAYKELSLKFPFLRLLLAPRHPQRAKSVCRIVGNSGFNPQAVSSLARNRGVIEDTGTSVFILDVLGALMNIYSIADVAFVGGSLVKKGGHNILEPAAFSKAIIFGPYMYNFRDIKDLFLRHKAAIQVKDRDELSREVIKLIEDRQMREAYGLNAKQVLLDGEGATLKVLSQIAGFLMNRE